MSLFPKRQNSTTRSIRPHKKRAPAIKNGTSTHRRRHHQSIATGRKSDARAVGVAAGGRSIPGAGGARGGGGGDAPCVGRSLGDGGTGARAGRRRLRRHWRHWPTMGARGRLLRSTPAPSSGAPSGARVDGCLVGVFAPFL